MKSLITPLLALMLVALAGCATGKGQLNPATGAYDPNAVADTLVVTVERTRELALESMDAVMRLESQNRAALLKLNPGIHKFAEGIRRNGRQTLNALTNAKVAFQTSRTSADATKLRESLAAAQSLLNDSVKYLAEIAGRKGTP